MYTAGRSRTQVMHQRLQTDAPPVQAALRSLDPCVRMPPLADAVGESQKRKMATVIAVANQKGGVGKTTTTANLGAALALRARRVLLVDLDPQGNLTSAFGLEKDVQHTIAESLLDRRVPLPVVPVANGAAHETTPERATWPSCPRRWAGQRRSAADEQARSRAALARSVVGRRGQLRLCDDRHAAVAGRAHHQRAGGGDQGHHSHRGALLFAARACRCSKKASRRSCT